MICSRVGWSLSFDNINERFEYVRWGSNWQTLDKNVTTVANRVKTSQQHAGIQAVYTIYNCTRLCELKEYADSKGLWLNWQHVWGDQLDPHQHNSAIKKLAIEELKRFRDNFTLNEGEKVWVQNQFEQFQNKQGTKTKEFLEFTKDIKKNGILIKKDNLKNYGQNWLQFYDRRIRLCANNRVNTVCKCNS